jgi:MarR family transcriptional regulator, organic hydroperoxide resistance regulator
LYSWLVRFVLCILFLTIVLYQTNVSTMADTEGIISTISTVRGKAYRYISQQLKKMGIEDIATPYGGIFMSLFSNSPLTMGEIARNIQRDKSTVTVLIRKLSDLGYVETSASPNDARATFVRLSKKGKALEPVFLEISKKVRKKIFKGFTEEEKEMLAGLLEKARDNF